MNFVNQYVAIGDAGDARNFEALRKAGIRYIVNVAQGMAIDPPHDLYVIKFGGLVSGQYITPLIKLLSWLTGYLKARVLVHCAAGMNRSPAVVICYLMDAWALPEAAAVQLVREKRAGCEPTMPIVEQWKQENEKLHTNPQTWKEITMSVGRRLQDLLDEAYALFPKNRTFIIAETGCIRSIDPPVEDSDGWSSLHIARWVAAHPDTKFHSIELHPDNIVKAGRLMGESNVAAGVEFHQGESVDELGKLDLIDFAYLDTSDDLAHGLAEFKVAEAKGALMITMDDRDTKCLAAIAYAKESGRWGVDDSGRTVVMRRQ